MVLLVHGGREDSGIRRGSSVQWRMEPFEVRDLPACLILDVERPRHLVGTHVDRIQFPSLGSRTKDAASGCSTMIPHPIDPSRARQTTEFPEVIKICH